MTLQKKSGLVRELNPGPLAPEARIIPLDQQAFNSNITTFINQVYKKLVFSIIFEISNANYSKTKHGQGDLKAFLESHNPPLSFTHRKAGKATNIMSLTRHNLSGKNIFQKGKIIIYGLVKFAEIQTFSQKEMFLGL